MQYTQKITSAFNLSNDPYDVVLTETEQKLVDLATHVATSLGLRPTMLNTVLEGTASIGAIMEEMRSTLLKENLESTTDHVSDKPKYSSSIDQRKEELKKLRQQEQDEHREGGKQRVTNADRLVNPHGQSQRDIEDNKKNIINWLIKIPKDERAVKIKEVINKIIKAANTVLMGGGKKFMMTQGYRPQTGMDSPVPKANMGNPSSEDRIIHDTILNEFGGILQKIRGLFSGGGKQTNAKDTNTVDYSIARIIDKIDKSQVDTHTQKTILGGIIKDIVKNTGARFRPESDDQQAKTISGYVDKVVKAQDKKSEKGFNISIAKLNREKAVSVVKAFKKELEDRGFKVTINHNKRINSVEFVFSAKDAAAVGPSVDKDATTLDDATKSHVYQLTKDGTPISGSVMAKIDGKYVISHGGKKYNVPQSTARALMNGNEIHGYTVKSLADKAGGKKSLWKS